MKINSKRKAAKNERKSRMKGKWRVITNSGKMDWRSPKSLIALIQAAWKPYGGIGLDPCANQRKKYRFAKRNYDGKKIDGLVTSWRGRGLVYVNPEYGRVLVKWIQKAVHEMQSGDDNDELILLTPARTDTRWFQDELRPHADAVCFWKGRMHFDEHGDPAPFASLLTYFGSRKKLFKETFEQFGWVMIQ